MVFSGFFDEPKQQRARPSFNKKDKEFLYERQKRKCNGCKRSLPMDVLHVDHIRAFSKGGSDKPSNLQLLCGPCNGKKGNGTQAQFEKKLAQEKGKGKAAASKSTTATKKTTAVKKSTTKKTTTKPKDPLADLFGF